MMAVLWSGRCSRAGPAARASDIWGHPELGGRSPQSHKVFGGGLDSERTRLLGSRWPKTPRLERLAAWPARSARAKPETGMLQLVNQSGGSACRRSRLASAVGPSPSPQDRAACLPRYARDEAL